MALNTKIKPLKLKKHELNIYRNLIKPRFNNNPENQNGFIRNIPGNKSYAQATVPQTAQGLPTMSLFLGIASLTLVLN